VPRRNRRRKADHSTKPEDASSALSKSRCNRWNEGARHVINPRNYRVTETLRDGTAVTIRAIHRDDRGKVVAAFMNLDRESIYTRFFTHKSSLSEKEVRQLTDVDFHHVVALVVTTTTEDGETIIAGARYVADDAPSPCRRAEVAFTTEEDYRGRGIACLLLRHLARIARQNGVSQLEADVLTGNQPMLNVFRRSGLPMQRHSADGVIHVILSLPQSAEGSAH
jgi:GNAT superfamily N-acetyltransferase